MRVPRRRGVGLRAPPGAPVVVMAVVTVFRDVGAGRQAEARLPVIHPPAGWGHGDIRP